MLIVSPVAATVPAMPRPMGTRISTMPAPWATFDQISLVRRSTRNSVERSACSTAEVRSMILRSRAVHLQLGGERLHDVQQELGGLAPLLDLLHLLGVAQRDGDLADEGAEQPLVVLVERLAVEAVEELEHGHHPAADVDDRRAQDRAGAVAGPAIDLLVEALVGVGVVDVDRLAAGRDRPAMPWPMGTRISRTSSPCAIFDHSSPRSSSTTNSDERSAFIRREALSMMTCSRRVRFSSRLSVWMASSSSETLRGSVAGSSGGGRCAPAGLGHRVAERPAVLAQPRLGPGPLAAVAPAALGAAVVALRGAARRRGDRGARRRRRRGRTPRRSW